MSAVLPVSRLASREGWKSLEEGSEKEGRTEALNFNVKLFDSELEDLPYVSSVMYSSLRKFHKQAYIMTPDV